MDVKIDTKEKFHEILVLEHQLTANMTAEATQYLSGLLENPVKNVILLLNEVKNVALGFAEGLVELQSSFYGQGASFVICGLQPEVRKKLGEAGLLDEMNTTPTLSEAWDIVQMEEIEREYLDGFED